MIFGFWKLVVVTAAAAYGMHRSGLLRHPLLRTLLRPGIAPTRAARPSSPTRERRPIWGDRLYLFLLVVAAVAVAAWVATRTLIHAPIALDRPGP